MQQPKRQERDVTLREAWPEPQPKRQNDTKGKSGNAVRYGQSGRAAAPHRSSAARRRKRRRQRLLILAAMALIVVLLITLLVMGLMHLFGNRVEPEPEASTPPVSVYVPPQSAVREPEPVDTRAATPYDEAAVPPLFNYDNPIPASYLNTMELVSVSGGHQMETRAAAAYTAMSEAAAADDLTLVSVSGYRTNARQSSNYNASIQRYLDQGLSQARAEELTEGYYALPGTSEHEAGLAMDIGFIDDSFEATAEFEWLQEHCHEYGFILRYREEDFDITHIHYEPWHYRYVGANHAEKMAELGITTLEEYVASLENEMG